MIPPSDLPQRIASALALHQFPHKAWSLMTDEEKGFYLQDTFEFLAALKLAGLTLHDTQLSPPQE